MFSAGLVPDTTTRNQLIAGIAKYLSTGPCTGPMCDLYQVNGGSFSPTFVNRPVVGGVYSLLARDMPVKPLGAIGNQKNSAIALSRYILSLWVSSLLSRDDALSDSAIRPLFFLQILICYNALSIL